MDRGLRARSTTDPYFSPPVQNHRGEPDTRDRHTNLTNHLITSNPTPLTDSARARPHPEQLTLNHTRTPGDARVATNHVRSTPLTRKRGGGDGEGNGAQAGEQRGSSSPWRLHHSPLVPQNSKIALCGSTNCGGVLSPPVHLARYILQVLPFRKVCLHERTFETFGWVVPSVVSFLCACKPLTTSQGCLWNAGRRGGTPPFASSCASLGGLCLRAEAGCCCRAEAVHSPARIRACYSCALPTVGADRECGRQRSHMQPDPTCSSG